MLFAWTNIALVLGVWRLLPRVAPDAGPWSRATVGLGLGMGLAIGSMLLLGIVGGLHPVPMAALVTVGLLLTLAADRVRPPPSSPARPVASSPDLALGSALLGASASVWIVRSGWARTGFCFDDVVYHAAVPASWVQDGRIGPSALTYQSYYAFDAELLSTWFMLPVGHPAHAGLAVILFAALLVCSTLAIAESMDVPLAPVMVLLAAALASERMLYFTRTFSSTDLALAAWVVAALAMAALPPSRRTAVLSGLAAGAAMGTKVSAAGPVLVLAGWWAWQGRAQPVLPGLFVLCTLPLGAWWYLHNWVVTGNPLFPAEIGPFEGPLEKKVQRRTSLGWFIQKRGMKLGFWRTLMVSRLDWPLALGVPSLAGLGVGLAASRLPGRRAAGLVAAAGLAFLVLHPLQPFSGTINRPDAPMHDMVRYGTLPFVIGLPLIASVTSRRDHTDRVLLAVAACAWAGIVAARLPGMPAAEGLQMIAGGSVALVAAGTLGSWPAWLLPAGLIGATLALSARTDAKHEATREAMSTFGRRAADHREAWAAIDRLPEGSRIAWLSDLPPSHRFNLPLMGSRLQHRIVPVDPDGSDRSTPLHTRWRDDHPSRWWAEFQARPANDTTVARALIEADIDVLVLSRCHRDDRGAWPPPHARLRALTPERLLHQDACVELWDLAGAELPDAAPARRGDRRRRSRPIQSRPRPGPTVTGDVPP